MQVKLFKHDFHGFMVDATSVNDNAIHNIYHGDPNVPLEGKNVHVSTIGKELMDP
jgi:hypothetical protein